MPERPFTRELLDTIIVTKPAIDLLYNLRRSEPQFPSQPLKNIPSRDQTLSELLPNAPIAVSGTLWPYAFDTKKSEITAESMLEAFASQHAHAVATADRTTTPFRLGIPISPDEEGLFNWVHSVTVAVRQPDNQLRAALPPHTQHINFVDPQRVLHAKQTDHPFVALHCGSVICGLTQAQVQLIESAQKPVAHFYGKLPTSVDYKKQFGGVFVTKIIGK